MPKRRHFAGDPEQHKNNKGSTGMDAGNDVDQEFIALVKGRHYGKARALVGEVRDINIADPETGMTALHFAAAYRVTTLLETLWTRDDLNELARDGNGRYASELAWQIAGDEELGAALMEREHAYAQRHEQAAWPKPSMP